MSKQMTERQHIDAEEVDDELLDRMFDIERQKKDMDIKNGGVRDD